MARLLTAVTLCWALVACSATQPLRRGAWTEELTVERAGEDLVLAQLQFAASAPLGASHASSFPPAVLQLVRRHQVERLAVTLTRGCWILRSLPPSAALVPPPGLEMAVQFGPGVNNTQPALAELANALSGLLAAAVPSMVQHGALAAPAVGWFGGQAVQRQQIYGAAPQEALCSENIAAWLKLLPCRGQAGLAALLQPAAVLAAPLHSLRIHVSTALAAGGDECSERHVHLSLGATVLIDTGKRDGLGEGSGTQQVLESLFGAAVPPVCAAAAASSIHIPARKQDGAAWPVEGCKPSAEGWQTCPVGGGASAAEPVEMLACSTGPSTPRWALAVASQVAPVSPLIGRLSVAAKVTEGGDAKQAKQEALLHVMQVVPWQLSLRWRTLQLAVGGRATPLTDAAVAWRVLRPAQPRGRAALIELLMRLPAGGNSSSSGGGSGHAAAQRDVAVSIEFEKQLLTVYDSPPDASRGVDIPAAMVTLLPPGLSAPASAPPAAAVDRGEGRAASLLQSIAGGRGPQQRRGRVHLVHLPIPDASMPFNVVCFTSTALALYFGAAMNLLLRSPGEVVANAGGGGGRTLRQRARRLVAVLLLVGALALYLDKDLQRKADAWLAVWVQSRQALQVEL